MSKQRIIRDSFWTDTYIEKLTPDEKLLFIYLLTNPLCNVAGVYEIRAKRIGFETGYDVEVVETILKRFERDKKILRFEDWIVIVNHIKNQSLNPSIIQGCERIFKELPQGITQAVTGWVQTGLLNLTLLNLTLLNSTTPKKPVRGLSQEIKVIEKEKLGGDNKQSYGEFQLVLLTDEEHQKLVDALNEQVVGQLIAELDTYMSSTGKKYKNHYATLQGWARRKIADYTAKNTGRNQIAEI